MAANLICKIGVGLFCIGFCTDWEIEVSWETEFSLRENDDDFKLSYCFVNWCTIKSNFCCQSASFFLSSFFKYWTSSSKQLTLSSKFVFLSISLVVSLSLLLSSSSIYNDNDLLNPSTTDSMWLILVSFSSFSVSKELFNLSISFV